MPFCNSCGTYFAPGEGTETIRGTDKVGWGGVIPRTEAASYCTDCMQRRARMFRFLMLGCGALLSLIAGLVLLNWMSN